MNTQQFLSHFKNFIYQTYDDDRSRNDLSLAKNGIDLDLKGMNKRGASICFSINQFPPNKKQAKDCIGINAWAFEVDSLSKPEQLELILSSPIEHSLLVESKNSYHVYFLAEDGTIENWKRIQMGLIKHFDSDPVIKNLDRILRVPGYHHMKQPDDPYLVTVADITTDKNGAVIKHKEADMLKAFPYEGDLDVVYEIKKIPVSSDGDVFSYVGNMDQKFCLERFSGSQWVNGETFTFAKRGGEGGAIIHCNGKAANAWITPQGQIGGEAGPTITQWLGYYGHNKSDIAKAFREVLCHYLSPAVMGEKEPEPKKVIPKKEVTRENNIFTWGLQSIDKNIAPLKRGGIAMFASDANKGKTTFMYFLARRNFEEYGHKTLYMAIEDTKEERIREGAFMAAGITREQYRNEQHHDVDAYSRKKEELEAIEGVEFVGSNISEGRTIDDIIKKAETTEFDILVVDNYKSLSHPKEISHLPDQVSNVIAKLNQLARERNAVVVLVHHYGALSLDERKTLKNAEEVVWRDVSSLSSGVTWETNMKLIVQLQTRPNARTEEERNQTYLREDKQKGFSYAPPIMFYFDKGSYRDAYPEKVVEADLNFY